MTGVAPGHLTVFIELTPPPPDFVALLFPDKNQNGIAEFGDAFGQLIQFSLSTYQKIGGDYDGEAVITNTLQ